MPFVDIDHKCLGATHWACKKRMELEGAKAQCCECFPHENCSEGNGDAIDRLDDEVTRPDFDYSNLSPE